MATVPHDPDPPTLNAEDVAQMLRMGASTVRARAAAGEIRSVKLGTGKTARYRFRRSWVDEYVAAHTSGGPAPKPIPETIQTAE